MLVWRLIGTQFTRCGNLTSARLSQNGNYFCLIEGELCFTVFQANGSYKIRADQTVLPEAYSNEADALSAVSKLLLETCAATRDAGIYG